MIIIKKQQGENIERMLKRYKRKISNTKVLKELKDRKEYTKPSIEKRKEKQKAIYVEKKFGNKD